MLAVAGPPASAGASSSGALRGSPTPAARKLAESTLRHVEGLKQCAPFPPVSAALLGLATGQLSNPCIIGA